MKKQAIGTRTQSKVMQENSVRQANGIDLFEDYFSDSSLLISNECPLKKNEPISQPFLESERDYNVYVSPICSEQSPGGMTHVQKMLKKYSNLSLIKNIPATNTSKGFDKAGFVSGGGGLKMHTESYMLNESQNISSRANLVNNSINAGQTSRQSKRKVDNVSIGKKKSNRIKKKSHANDIPEPLDENKNMHYNQKNKTPGIKRHSIMKKRMKSNISKENQSTEVRRSKRSRLPPLAYWTNERLLYKFTASGGVEILGLKEGTKDYQNLVQTKPKTKSSKRMKNSVKKHKNNSKFNNYMDGIIVYDPYYENETVAKVIAPVESLEFKGPPATSKNNGYEIAKTFCFDNEKIVHGFLKIGGQKKKPPMTLNNYNAKFVIIEGNVEVGIHKTTVILKKHDSFLVPSGNVYFINNLLNTECLLSYVAIFDSILG